MATPPNPESADGLNKPPRGLDLLDVLFVGSASLAVFFAPLRGGMALYIALYTLTFLAVHFRHQRQRRYWIGSAAGAALITLGGVYWNMASPPRAPVAAVQQVAANIATAVPVSASPTSAIPLPSPTFPPPRFSVQRAGVGGPEQTVPARDGAWVTNHGDSILSVIAVVVDTDQRQQKVYGQLREDIEPNQTKFITFLAWYHGACYTPLVLAPKTQGGLDTMTRWLTDGGGGRSLAALTAMGDFTLVYEGDPICP